MAKIGLSKCKFKKMAVESLKNALRLHTDSTILFYHASFPSAFQLAVLAMEELSKTQWIDHYYYSSVTNEGFPDYDFEQDWLNLLYSHPKKQYAFVARELFKYSPVFAKFVENRKLELKKQQATYVGLNRQGNKIDTSSNISIPLKKIKENDAKQLISLINHEFLEIYKLIQVNEGYFGIYELDGVINPDKHQVLFTWPHKSRLKSTNYHEKWIKDFH